MKANTTIGKLMCDLCIVPHDEIGERSTRCGTAWNISRPGATKLLHYTDMDMQPWRHGHNPLRSIWRAYYRAAVEAGAVDPGRSRAASRGWLLPDWARRCTRAGTDGRSNRRPIARMAGTPSVRQRSLELECSCPRASWDCPALEANIAPRMPQADGRAQESGGLRP